jgi:hypothetical protein
MKKVLVILLLVTVCAAADAQEYKVSQSSGRLEIREVNRVTIEGTTGNEIVFKSSDQNRDRDERAVGLRAVSSLGLEDNTGIGLSVVDKGETIEVQQLRKTEGPRVTILVPKGVTVSYSHTSPYGDQIEIRNFEGTVDVSTVHNGVVLTNVSGPVTIKTVHGDIDASLSTVPRAALTLESIHGHVDLALPVATKANLSMRTQWGEVLVDPKFKIELNRTGEMVKYSGEVQGKLNGGGVDISLRTQHNNVYLRTK